VQLESVLSCNAETNTISAVCDDFNNDSANEQQQLDSKIQQLLAFKQSYSKCYFRNCLLKTELKLIYLRVKVFPVHVFDIAGLPVRQTVPLLNNCESLMKLTLVRELL